MIHAFAPLMAIENTNYSTLKMLLLVLISLSTTVNSKLYAQQINPPIHFTGTVIKSGPVGDKQDSLLIMYKKPTDPMRYKWEVVPEIIPDKSGHFDFVLPGFDKPILMRIAWRGENRWDDIQPWFVAESGDKIHMQIEKGNDGEGIAALFSGERSDKYNAVAKLNALDKERRRKIAALLNKSLDVKLRSYNLFMDTLIAKKDSIIQLVDDSEVVKEALQLNIAPLGFQWSFYYIGKYPPYSKGISPEEKALLRTYFNAYKTKFRFEVNNSVANYPAFLHYFVENEAHDLLINSAIDSVDLLALYQRIIHSYSGGIREGLLSNLFVGFSGITDRTVASDKRIDSLMKVGEQYVTTKQIKKLYTSRLRLTAGKQVFDTDFYNESGEKVSLRSLQGKVVLIDLWFTGCAACARFYQAFHERCYTKLSHRDDFIYLSVNTDRNPKVWTNSVKSGKYSSSEYLNVNTGTIGFEHPFCQYYEISAAPFLLLIDKKGKIVSSTEIASPEKALELITETLAL